MSTFKTHFTVLALVLSAAAMPALAGSSAASSASDSASTSVGSLSDSIGQSSKSSTGDDKVADGDYRVVEVAVADDRPGVLRLKLQATQVAQGGEFFLYVPQKAYEQGRLAQGEVVRTHTRAYGIEFARADDNRAFFLAMNDASRRELASNPVVL